MLDTLALLEGLRPSWDKTNVRRLSRIAQGMLAMSGRVTMLGISRWTEGEGSYRSVQRFFSTVIPWASLFWVLFQQQCYRRQERYILAGDEVVVTKAGRQTYGLDRFYSSLYDKAVPGVAFFALSLVAVGERQSYPVSVEQVVRTAEEKAAIEAAKAAKAAKQKAAQPGSPAPVSRGGRPKGRKTKAKDEVTLTPELQRLSAGLAALLSRIGGWLTVNYLVLDGHFGNNNALCMVRAQRLHLISKLRSDLALHQPYTGSNKRAKYGLRLDYQALPVAWLTQQSVTSGRTGTLQTNRYQGTAVHEQFAYPLNVVILEKINLRTQARGHVILFSSDLALAADVLVDYYSLRFQIKFNFRDAKQFWGLEDFMTIRQTTVTNAANLAFFMVNLSHCLLHEFRRTDPNASILDLKAYARGYRYATEIINLLPQKTKPSFWSQALNRLASLGRIHPPPHDATSA
ncbi:MAG: transposase [Cyanobacteria bacterium P01_A01_bin.123]